MIVMMACEQVGRQNLTTPRIAYLLVQFLTALAALEKGSAAIKTKFLMSIYDLDGGACAVMCLLPSQTRAL